MTFKTILAYCDADKSVEQRLGIATDLATRFDSHLVGLHVRPSFRPPVYFDSGFATDELYKLYEDTVAADQKTAMSAFAKATEGRNIAIEQEITDGIVEQVLTKRARWSDLVIVGQTGRDTPSATPSDLPETVALSCGHPVLVVPYVEVKWPIGKNIMVCWNASREAARAVTDALPLLKTADKVTVLAFSPGDEDAGTVDVAGWLSRHGIKARPEEESANGLDIAESILSRAADLDIDLLVMGVYGHTRVREMVLGGASRTLLQSMTVPVLMAH
jgi:nucleotide-binding universal stress UspA family protein